MLLIVVPVIALTLWFAWRYRQSNSAADYAPDWDHSTQLELVIWSAPLLIIIALGALTWISSHTLDPYRPLHRTGGLRPVAGAAATSLAATPAAAPGAATTPGAQTAVKPLTIQVVALDWKWLF